MSNVIANFREEGSGSTVVCVHSSASSSSQWRTLMGSLSNRFRVVAMDLYGYGKSPAWPGEHVLRLDDEIALMAPILETAGKFHLVGHYLRRTCGSQACVERCIKDCIAHTLRADLFLLAYRQWPRRPSQSGDQDCPRRN